MQNFDFVSEKSPFFKDVIDRFYMILAIK